MFKRNKLYFKYKKESLEFLIEKNKEYEVLLNIEA
jgi:hypothetical protein